MGGLLLNPGHFAVCNEVKIKRPDEGRRGFCARGNQGNERSVGRRGTKVQSSDDLSSGNGFFTMLTGTGTGDDGSPIW